MEQHDQGIRHLQTPGQTAVIADLSRTPHIVQREVIQAAGRVIHQEVVLHVVVVAGPVTRHLGPVLPEVQHLQGLPAVAVKVLQLRGNDKEFYLG